MTDDKKRISDTYWALLTSFVAAAVIAGVASVSAYGRETDPQPIVELRDLPTGCFCFSPDGSKLAVGGTNDSRAIIRIIDTGTWQPSAVVAVPGISVMALAFSADSSLLYGAADSDVVVIRVPDLQLLARLSRHTDLVFSIATSPDGRHVATSGQDGRVCVWDGKKLTHVKDLDRHADSIFALTFDARGNQLATVGRDIFRVWPTLERGKVVDVPFNDSALHVCFSPKGDVVVVATVSGGLVVAKCDQLTKPPQTYRLGSYLGGVAFVDGADFIAVGINRDLVLFDLKEGKIKRRLDGGESRIGGIEVESVNKRVAVGTWDGKVRIWNASDLVESDKADQNTSVPK